MMTKFSCTVTDLAEALDLSETQIFNLARSGVAVKVARGQYDLPRSMKNYYESKLDDAVGNPESLIEQRTRLTRYQADKAKLELDLLRGKSLPLDIVVVYFQKMISGVRSKMMGLSFMINTDIFPGIDKTDAVKIDNAIRDILTEAATMPIPKELDQRLKNHIKTFGEEENE